MRGHDADSKVADLKKKLQEGEHQFLREKKTLRFFKIYFFSISSFLALLFLWQCAPSVNTPPPAVPTSASLCSGTSLLGAVGSAICIATTQVLQSTAHRSVGTTQLTQTQEVTTYAGSTGAPPTSNLPSNYREIMDGQLDDDGKFSYTSGNSQYGIRPQVACGNTGTILSRISDCATKNGSNATWNGASQGAAGQGVWKLVFSSGQAVAGTCSTAAASTDCYEIWQDQRTGLLWSSSVIRYIGTANFGLNHCLASGNSENGSGWLASGGGPGIDCSTTGSYQYGTSGNTQYGSIPGSECSESAETGGVQSIKGICNSSPVTTLTQTACGANTWYPNNLTLSGGVENYTTGVYSIAKGYLGALSSPGIRWRLPNKYDYLQADIDGIRFVMPDMGIAGLGTNNRSIDGTPGSLGIIFEWSSSIESDIRTNAVIYFGTNGASQGASRSNAYISRCVGR